MKIIAVSGSGIGAGKTTLARKLSREVWSLAGSMRAELQKIYPDYNWFNKDQDYKANTKIKEYKNGQYSMRGVLLEYGQEKCRVNDTYWVEKLSSTVKNLDRVASGITTIAIDDLRKLCEISYLRENFSDVIHVHIDFPGAVSEKEFENEALKQCADYVVSRKS